MPAERVAMRQAREIIRLKFSAGLPTREIARRLRVAASTVRGTLRRFEGAGLSWPLPVGMSDGDLEAALYANHGTKRGHRRHAEPDWPTVHRELKRKHVTLVIVWDEYIAANPGGYSYSRFCELYRGFESKLSPTMRQTHAGRAAPLGVGGARKEHESQRHERLAGAKIHISGPCLFEPVRWQMTLPELPRQSRSCGDLAKRCARRADKRISFRSRLTKPDASPDVSSVAACPRSVR